jgi:hypothetical protein
MNWRTTTVNLDSHVFDADMKEVESLVNWWVIDRSRGTIVVGLDNCHLCVRNDRQIVVVRVRDDLDSIQNEHEILEVLNELTGKTIRKLD